MALRLESLTRSDNLMAIAYGLVNGLVLDKSPLGFLLLNVAVAGTDLLGIKLPNGVKVGAYNNLGIVLWAIIRGLKR
jgi:hypothetical protein